MIRMMTPIESIITKIRSSKEREGKLLLDVSQKKM